jgi:hypothetical protein
VAANADEASRRRMKMALATAGRTVTSGVGMIHRMVLPLQGRDPGGWDNPGLREFDDRCPGLDSRSPLGTHAGSSTSTSTKGRDAVRSHRPEGPEEQSPGLREFDDRCPG